MESENVTRYALRDFVDSIFDGSPEGLVSYLIKNEYVSPDEMSRIREMLNGTVKNNMKK